MKYPTTLENWTNLQLSVGKMTFSLSQVKTEFNELSDIAIKESLRRLSKKKKILSVHKGFYIIIPPHYYSAGVLPPSIFIDSLMNHLNKSYYACLLSAAAMHGAGHQQPQEFYVMTTAPAMRPLVKKQIKINYVIKNRFPKNLIDKKKVETGYVNVSSPELTAIDLMQYESRIGGINRVVTILAELIEEFNLDHINDQLLEESSISTIQRLGYLLEIELEENPCSEKLFEICKKRKVIFNRIPLSRNEPFLGFNSKNRWNVIVNTKIEID